MLKFTYTETALFLEHLSDALDQWIELRMRLSRQVKRHLRMERCSASFLLPINLAERALLYETDDYDVWDSLEWAIADPESIEIILRGIWLSSGAVDSEGVFLTCLSDRAEAKLMQLWQESQANITALQG